jgi:hypothetical protein
MAKRRTFLLTLTLALLGVALFAQASTAAKGPKLLEWGTMVGNTQAFTGATNPIRNINGGGVPWVLSSAKGELSPDGALEIKVRGLVLASSGSNPSAVFRGLVSCLDGNAGIVNVLTANFPATTGPATAGGGNADIETTVSLPDPCIAPIVFVTSGTGSWFASTGG